MEELPLVRRSTLILPVNRQKFVEKSWKRNADAVQLDLEDSILDSEKNNARDLVKDAIMIAGQGGGDVLVRINNHPIDLVKDLEASIFPSLHGIIIPKIESPLQVKEIEERIESLEKSRNLEVGDIKLGLLIETAKGLVKMNDIVLASKRAETITLGTEDFLLDLEIEINDGQELLLPKLQVIIAARYARIQPIGLIGSMSNYKDLEGLYNDARRSYQYGFKGSSCIHPSQVSVLNKAFSPTDEDVVHANRVIDIYEQSKVSGEGTASLDGIMIDTPIVSRAYKVIERRKAIDRLEQRKKSAIESVI